MTRRRWLLVLGIVVLVGAAVAAGVIARGGSAARPFGDPRMRAHQLLSELVLPPGAQRLGAAPRGDGGLLHQAQEMPGDTVLVHLHRLWRVHRSYFDVPSFVENHLPSDAQGVTRGGGGGPGIPYRNEGDTYSFPISGNIAVFWLDLTFVGLPHGWTGMRADAIVAGCPCVHH
jgi:hypothetical protein